MEQNIKPKKPFYKKWWFWVLAVIIIGGIGGSSGKEEKTKDVSSKPPVEQKIKEKTPEEIEAEKKAKEEKELQSKRATLITTAQSVVKENLKAPSTAKFPWSFNEYNIKESTSENKDMTIYYVSGYVDAENSFGAKIRSNFIVEMECTKDLSKYRVLDIAIE
ncbi:hypothetical protein HF847_05145 [Clostridium cochlearium]|uniref:hypothetical protein n=1 Tax=Clostridium cochlearium TaxID=1494 RepID=UPI001459F288|nr:hypothetical protein [Clostridium cochlearium]NME95379.1 hypothetical protein [Clostridium cochlearium]